MTHELFLCSSLRRLSQSLVEQGITDVSHEVIGLGFYSVQLAQEPNLGWDLFVTPKFLDGTLAEQINQKNLDVDSSDPSLWSLPREAIPQPDILKWQPLIPQIVQWMMLPLRPPLSQLNFEQGYAQLADLKPAAIVIPWDSQLHSSVAPQLELEDPLVSILESLLSYKFHPKVFLTFRKIEDFFKALKILQELKTLPIERTQAFVRL